VAFIAIGSSLTGPNGEIFKITDFRGRGAFGEVYRAVGDSAGAVLAVKLLPVSSFPAEDFNIALLNEVRAAQQVRHPNIVRGFMSTTGPSRRLDLTCLWSTFRAGRWRNFSGGKPRRMPKFL
jgi:hypothetical protein